jgi:hypothetical protein
MAQHLALKYNQLIIDANRQCRNLRLLDAADKTGLDLDEDGAW